MKILKEGNPKIPPVPPFWVGWVFNCHCGTEFKLEMGDVIRQFSQERCPNGKTTVIVSCPICDKATSSTDVEQKLV